MRSVLVIGESGTGKSTAIRTLPPSETFVISVVGKSLPFRGASKLYKRLSEDGATGNFYASDKLDVIRRVVKLVNNKRHDIKYLVIDDAGYTLMNDYIRRGLEKGFDKYSALAKDFGELIQSLQILRDDLFCFITMHVETKDDKTKPKTVGKAIDNYVCIEGNFTTVLHSIIYDGQYKLITQNDGYHMAKSPMGLFADKLIDNDFLFVANAIDSYLNDDIGENNEIPA